ncbi:hypothetical protein LTR22_019051 [Elasticomyces elasticus]|nr:hypothetical protein LTR22_019051 [Elasticomyces elasticus]KAK4911930.1 hypothetical protein LTR49_019577 [Elasticomyces elasticus]KAK5743051.1 hypothetical protein LTS12_024007 [Elasticomyces elasticus]
MAAAIATTAAPPWITPAAVLGTIFSKRADIVDLQLCGSGNAPYCFEYALSESLNALSTIYSYGCSASPATVLALMSATNAEEGDAASLTPMTSTTGIFAATSLSGIDTTMRTSSSGSVGSTSTAGSSKDGSNNPILSPGEIAGIVIAGAACLVIAAFLGFYLRRKLTRQIGRIRHRQRPTGPGIMPYEPTDGGFTELKNVAPATAQTAQWAAMHAQSHRGY